MVKQTKFIVMWDALEQNNLQWSSSAPRSKIPEDLFSKHCGDRTSIM